MHIVRSTFKSKRGKIYQTVLLRESYREGKKVKKRTIANLSNCSEDEIKAIELALRHKADLSELGSLKEAKIKEGLSVGGVWAIFEVAKRLGIVDALGSHHQGQLALWQVLTRVLEQGSRLSAVRLAETYAIASVIGLEKGFNEEDLYKNLSWLTDKQAEIEDKIFDKRFSDEKPNLFLYDVTSSYLEGKQNELADWGYNRDKKKGKKQIVVGLLCADDGTPITTEVFKGNTQDTTTFVSQIKKVRERFGCENVSLVGDRGMIKSSQIENLEKHGFHYITAMTKAQIETLVKKDVIQYNLFDDNVTEVEKDNIRYILKRNPVRAEELKNCRESKQIKVATLTREKNIYLQNHPKAKVATAIKEINNKLTKLKLANWLSVDVQDRTLSLKIDEETLNEDKKLDGCYVIKTDLPAKDANTLVVHDRYKDLAFVESAFRTVKSDLDIRPVYVRSENNTRGHVLVVMLAYMIIKELEKAWQELYLTVSEGLRSLSTLCMLEVSIGDESSFQQIAEPRQQNKQMLAALGVTLPKVLAKNQVNVVTRKARRKMAVKI